MNHDAHQMKPIWYFVGWMSIIIGCLVLTAGVYYLFVPIELNIKLREMNISIWWGIILILGGMLLTIFNRKPAAL